MRNRNRGSGSRSYLRNLGSGGRQRMGGMGFGKRAYDFYNPGGDHFNDDGVANNGWMDFYNPGKGHDDNVYDD